MSTNPFDRFDPPANGDTTNAFDRFDPPEQARIGPTPSPPQSIEDLLSNSPEPAQPQPPRPLPVDFPAPGRFPNRNVRLASTDASFVPEQAQATPPQQSASLGFPNGIEAPAAPPPQPQRPRARAGGGPIHDIIAAAADEYGLDTGVLSRFAQIESGLDPNARTGSYRGLFQLGPEEWARYGGGGNIFDPVHNARAAAAKLVDESRAFADRFGRPPDPADLYLIHQQGQAGYASHASNPDAPAWQNMYATAEGRQKGAEWARKAIWGNIPDRDKARFGSVDNITSRDFIDLWRRKVMGDGSVADVNVRPDPSSTALSAAYDPEDLLRRVLSAPPDERKEIVAQEIHNILGIPVDDRSPPGSIGMRGPVREYPAFTEDGGFGAQAPLPRSRPASAPPRSTAPNVFDQFDNQPTLKPNPFDQFDRDRPLPGSAFDYVREALFGKPEATKPTAAVEPPNAQDRVAAAPPQDLPKPTPARGDLGLPGLSPEGAATPTTAAPTAPAGAKDPNRVGQPVPAQPQQEDADQTGNLGLPGLETGAQSQARAAQPTAPAAAQDDWGGYLPVAGKGLARGAIDFAGKTVKGAEALAAGPQPLSEGASVLLDELAAAPKSTADRVVLMRKAAATLPRPLAIDFNAAMMRVARGGDAAAERGKLEQSFKEWNEAAAKPKTERPLYQAGEVVSKFGKKTFPLTPTEEQSITGLVAQTVGSMGPLIAGGAVLGPGAALGAGAGAFAMSSAADTFDDAMSKGADEKTAAKAAGLSALVGGTIGVLPLGAVFAPVKREAPGLMGWAAAKLQQAATSGVTFATVGEAQHWLGQQIAAEYYDPEAKTIRQALTQGLTPKEREESFKRVLVGLASGAALGVMHPVGKAQDREAVRDKVGEFIYEADRASARAAGAKTDEEVADFIRKKYADKPQPGRGKAWRDEIDEFLRQREAKEGGSAGPKGEEPPAAGAAAEPEPYPEKPPGSPGGAAAGTVDPLYEQAKKIVVGDNNASTSYLQRKLKLKYGDAAAIMARLEDEGVVSAANKYGKRTVIRPEESAAAGPAGAETGAAAVAGDQPSAEPVKDLLAQAEDLKAKDHPRQAVWLPKASLDNLNSHSEIAAQVLGSGMPVDNFDGQGGTLVAKDAATADAARYARDRAFEQFTSPADRSAVMQGLIGRLTGAGAGKPADATHVVQQVTPEGAVSRETAVRAGDVAQTENDLAMPDREVRTVTPEAALGRREDEIAAEGEHIDLSNAAKGPGSPAAPVVVERPEDVAAASLRVAEPTEAQKAANNYRHGHIIVQGLPISIKTPKGGIRKGDGWSVRIPAAYGYVRAKARSRDKEHVDVYVGDDVQSDRAFVVDQHDLRTGAFDEPKLILGVRSKRDAAELYDSGFSDGRGPERRRAVTGVSIEKLKAWLETGDATKPFARVPRLAGHEEALLQPEGKNVSQVRGEGDRRLSTVEGKLPDVPEGHGAETVATPLPGSTGRSQGLQPGQLPLGDQERAGTEPAGVRSRNDIRGTDDDGRGVGPRDRDQRTNSLQSGVQRTLGRGSAEERDVPARGTSNLTDVSGKNVPREEMGEGTRDRTINPDATDRAGMARRQDTESSTAVRAASDALTGNLPTPAISVGEARTNLEQAKNRARELQRRMDALNEKLEQKPPTPRNALDKERIDKNRAITERIARGLRRKTAEAFDAVDDARAALKQAESDDAVARQRRESEAPAATGTAKPERQPRTAPAESSAPSGEMPGIPEFLQRKKETARVEEAPHAEAAEGAEPAQVPVPAEAGTHAKAARPEAAQGPQGEVGETPTAEPPAGAKEESIADAYFRLTNGKSNQRVFLSDLRKETGLSRPEFDEAARSLHLKPGYTLSGLDNPRERTAEVQSGGLDFKGVDMYALWITKPQQKATPSAAQVFRLPERMTRTSVEEIAPRAASLSPEEKQAVHDWIEREFDRMEKDGKRIEKHCLGSGKRFSIK